MSVLIDTTIWSLAIRRDPDSLNSRERAIVAEWERLMRSGEAALIGSIRQEVLSGIREGKDFEILRIRLESFPELDMGPEDWVETARCFNRCRRKGVTAATIDFAICAVAINRGIEIYSTDEDFTQLARHLPIRLHAA